MKAVNKQTKNYYSGKSKKRTDSQQRLSTNNKNYRRKKVQSYKPRVVENKPSVKIAFLGGLNEIGKNITLFECEGDIVILDCGMAFPDGDMLGVDLVIPDFSYIEQNIDRVKGVVLTHGHEDHIGGIPYLLSKFNIPIYGTPLTIGLLGNKLKEHNLYNSELFCVDSSYC